MPRSASKAQPGALPTGSVTFLFSDIEGSSLRWDAHCDAMAAAVKRHDAIVRAAIERRSGFVFKTVGDAFCAAFHTPADAVAAAVAMQHALHKEDFSAVGGLLVRIGLHTGTADERNGDYFGPAVNRVARLMSIGHGGQVLVSEATRMTLGSDVEPGVRLADLGSRRLKDLTQPEHVWQLSIAGLPVEFPPLNSLDARPNNLPIQTTPLLGRERDLETGKELLAAHRLLTISGAGGVGKTRLALQVGADLIDRYEHGVWFADLAPISDGGLVSSVVAKALELSQSSTESTEETILRILKRRQLLLILDNCEHLLDAMAPLADGILKSCPHVRLLATSREALGVAGEDVWLLPSLDVPAAEAALSAESARGYGAVALFADRASLIDKSFRLTDDNAMVVAEICRRLDGIALAIELAAARVKVLSVPNLAQRLDERFKILTGGSRTALPRQKTLGALIDWSYDLLTPQEQTLFNRSGVFAGTFSLDSVTAVCACDSIDPVDVLDLLSSLVDKSLVVADTREEFERYRLLESTRAYAVEKLRQTSEFDRMVRRHGEHFTAVAIAADVRYGRGSTAAWLMRLEPDIDNFRATLEWALHHSNDVALGAAIAGPLEPLWQFGGLASEGRRWIRMGLERLDESEHTAIAARLWLALARLTWANQCYEAADRSRILSARIGDGPAEARAASQAAFGLMEMGRLDEASEAIERGLAGARRHGDEFTVARSLSTKGVIAASRGDLPAAKEMHAQALAAFKAIGDEAGVAVVSVNLAEVAFAAGDVAQALNLTSDALAISSRGKNAQALAVENNNSAVYRVALGDLDGARDAARAGMRWAHEAQSTLAITNGVQHAALIAALRREPELAAKLLGFADIGYGALGQERESTEKWGYATLIASLREQLSKAEIEALAAEGAAWSEDQALERAMTV